MKEQRPIRLCEVCHKPIRKKNPKTPINYHDHCNPYPKRKCEYCGKWFYPQSPQSRFCSHRCYSDYYKSEREQEKSYHCLICGASCWGPTCYKKSCKNKLALILHILKKLSKSQVRKLAQGYTPKFR